MRKIYLELKVKLVLEVEEGISIDSCIDKLEMDFTPIDETIEVVDSSIENFVLTDSK